MTTTDWQDILFDDFSMLQKLVGKHELTLSPPNTNCDCIGYSSDHEDVDTDKIAPASDQTI